MTPLLGGLALAGRILLLGAERVVVKRLGASASATGVAPAFLFFVIATLFLAPVAVAGSGISGLAWLLSGHAALTILANGLVYSAAFVLYVSALAAGEASFASPFYNFNAAFLLVLAVAFLGEGVSVAKVGGIALLVAGSWVLARRTPGLARAAGQGVGSPQAVPAATNRRAALLMIGCSLLMAVGRTVDTSQVRAAGSMVYAFAINAAVTLWLAVFVVGTRRGGEVARILREKPWTALTAGAINAFSYLLLLVALGVMEVSVAEPASMLSLLVTLLLAGFVFHERVSSRVVPTLLMIAGAWMLLG